MILKRLTRPKVSEVYEAYWRFAAERQAVFFHRIRGEAPPWTHDRVLATYKFTNAYRASDRVSQFLIRNVIYRRDLPQSAREIVFRILLFKFFNRIETWELLENVLGPITFEDFEFGRYDNVLRRTRDSGRAIYSAAYIMPPGNRAFGRRAKHQNHLLLLQRMLRERLPERLADCRTMQEGFEKLRAYPMIGDFLAYQYIIDINYSEVLDLSEMEFVVPGPGALDGLRKCFTDPKGLAAHYLIRFVADAQQAEFARRHLDFQSLWGRPLQLVDCQNLFCEIDKYSRVAYPHVLGRAGRKRIKRKFQPARDSIKLFYPPKWGLEKRIPAGAEIPACPVGPLSLLTGIPLRPT